MPERPSDEDVVSMVSEIDEAGEGLTRWEIDFIADMMRRSTFTESQIEKIEQIWRDRIGDNYSSPLERPDEPFE